MKTVKKFAPYYAQEMEYIESYLCDMASNGLFLKKWTSLFAEFEQGEPKQIRYRVVPKHVEAEEKDIFEESGWNYVCKKGISDGFSVFCTEDETVPELFTDMGSYRTYMKKFKRTCILNAVLIPILFLLWGWNFRFDFTQAEGPLHFLLNSGLGMIAIVVALFIYWLMILIMSIKNINRIRNRDKIQRDAPYKRALGTHKVIEIAVVVTFLITMIGLVSQLHIDTPEEPIQHPVTLQELDPEAWEDLRYAMDHNDWGDGGLYYDASEYSDTLIHCIDVYSDTENAVYRAHYYEAISETIAEQWLKEEISYDLKADFDLGETIMPEVQFPDSKEKVWKSDIYQQIRIPSDEIDYIGYYVSDEFQNLYLRDGEKIEMIGYHGDKNLLDEIELFIEDIKNAT